MIRSYNKDELWKITKESYAMDTRRKGRPNENWKVGVRRCMGLKEQDVDTLDREQLRKKIK